MAGFGRLPLGHKAVIRARGTKQAKQRVTKQAKLARDKARLRLWEMRQKLKLKVKGNEGEMKRRKRELRKSLNPTFVPLMPSREYAKMIRNPANWASVPPKPKYSRIDPRLRVYGKRFEIWETKLLGKPREMPRKYEDAAKKMAESVADLRKDIAEGAKKVEARIAEADWGTKRRSRRNIPEGLT